MEEIKVFKDALRFVTPILSIMELHRPSGTPKFENERIAWWDDEIIVPYQKRMFSIGWLDVKTFKKDQVSEDSFEFHKQGDEFFLNLSKTATLFLPVIEVDRGNNIVVHQIVELWPKASCVMPARVIHTPPFQNQEDIATVLVFKKYSLDLEPVVTKKPLEFDLKD